MKIHRGPGRPPKNQAAEPATQQSPEIVPEAVEPAQAPEPQQPLTPEEAAHRIDEILSRLYEATRHDRNGYYRNIQFEYRHVYKQVQRAIEDVRAVIKSDLLAYYAHKSVANAAQTAPEGGDSDGGA